MADRKDAQGSSRGRGRGRKRGAEEGRESEARKPGRPRKQNPIANLSPKAEPDPEPGPAKVPRRSSPSDRELDRSGFLVHVSFVDFPQLLCITVCASRFSEEHNDITIACIAIVLNSMKNILRVEDKTIDFNWSPLDLDSNIVLGEHLYNISMSQLSADDREIGCLTFNDVYKYCVIDEKVYTFFDVNGYTEIDAKDKEQYYIRHSDCQLKQLIADLKAFNDKGIQAAIFTCNNFSFAVFFERQKYIFFDSNERNQCGFPMENTDDSSYEEGTAILCANDTVTGLAYHLMHNCSLGYHTDDMNEPKVPYTLAAVWVKRVVSTGNVAEFNRIKRKWQSDEKKKEAALAKKVKRSKKQKSKDGLD